MPNSAPNHVSNVVDNTLGANGWSRPNGNFARLWAQYSAGDISLAALPADLRAQLKIADADGDGRLTMREARDFLIQNSIVRQDGEADDFKVALEYAFGQLTGVAVDPGDAPRDTRPAHICYIQLNNLGGHNLHEEKDIRKFARRDPDAPTVDKLNWTRQFNTHGDVGRATKAFVDGIKAYMDRLIAAGERMTGFVLSGHSNGTAMLQETEHHHYESNLYPREELMKLREIPKYRKMFDSVEKVAALGCFQGGALAEWAEIFPKACIAGTRRFSPLANAYNDYVGYGPSGAIYDVAARAHQVLEDGGNVEGAKGEQFRGGFRTFLNNDRKLAVHVPDQSAAVLAEKQEVMETTERYFEFQGDVIAKMVTQGGAGIEQSKLDGAYDVARQYILARQDFFVTSGREAGAEEAEKIGMLDFLSRDLFTIRKHQARLELPADWAEDYWREFLPDAVV